MKVTEIQAETHKLSRLDVDFFVVRGPIHFTWGDEPFEPTEINVDFSKRDMSATFDMEITKEEVDLLWDL